MTKPRSGRDHRYRHVTEMVYGKPWAITPEKLNEICEVVDRRNALAADDPVNTLAAANWDDTDDDDDEEDYQLTSQGVAILSLHGIISQRMNMFGRFSGGTSTEEFAKTFQKAMADAAVKAVVLDVNSPGGQVHGTAELANVIYNARGAKPIVAVANTQMCSGAYWIASSADRVVASPSSDVGSIGVIFVHTEISKLDAVAGRTRTLVSAGKYKTVGNDVEPLSDAARAKLQEWVSGTYELFLTAVARNRGTTAERVRHGYGEGDSLLADDALAAGLVDRVASLAEVVEGLATGTTSLPNPQSPTPNPSSLVKGVQSMDERIVAALFAKGLIPKQDPALAAAALPVYFAGLGKPVPADVVETVAAVMAPLALALATAAKTLVATELKTFDPVKMADGAAMVDAKQIAAEERHRAATIRARAKILGVEAVGEKLVDAGIADAEAMATLFEAHVGKKGESDVPPRLDGQNERIEFGASGQEKFALAADESLSARCLASAGQPAATAKLSAPAKEMLSLGIFDMAAESLRCEGYNLRGMSRERIAKMALAGPIGIAQGGLYAGAMPTAFYSTGNFANLALNASHKVLQRAFQEAPVSYRQWVRQGEAVVDFKVQSIVKMSAASDLEETPEGTDTPTDTGLTDDREWFQVARYSKEVGFTFQMLVNDDLSALSRIPQLHGVAAARTFNKLVYGLLTGNPTMADGYALFDATYHQGNLLSGTTEAPTTASLAKMQAVLRKMKNLNTDATLSLFLRWLIVPAALEAVTYALLRSIGDPALTNANVKSFFFGTTDPVVEPLLDANSAAYFYGVADNALVDTITVRFLQGQETPAMDSYWDPKKFTRFFQVSQAGAAVLEEYRGIVRDNGT